MGGMIELAEIFAITFFSVLAILVVGIVTAIVVTVRRRRARRLL